MFINTHTHTQVHDAKLELVNQDMDSTDKANHYSYGLHPWYIDKETYHDQLNKLEVIAHEKRCLAIGECGLDRYAKAEMPAQETIFIKHAELSETLKKPLIIHCVKAFNELLRIHKDFSPKMPWIVHGFNRNPEIAELLLNRNMILSIGAILLDNRQSIVDMMNMIPDKQLVLETDISTVSISEIYKAASKAKQMTLEDLTFSIEHTIHSIYGHI